MFKSRQRLTGPDSFLEQALIHFEPAMLGLNRPLWLEIIGDKVNSEHVDFLDESAGRFWLTESS